MPTPKDSIDAARQAIVDDLPEMARKYADIALAEGTSQAFQRYFDTAAKIIPDLAANEKKDQYANLPMIHFTIGPGLQVTTTVEQPQVTADVTDVEPKVASPFGASASKEFDTLPEDVLDLLPVSAEETQVRETLEAAAGAMAMPDD